MKDYKVTIIPNGKFPGFEFFTKAHDFQDALLRVETEWNRLNSAPNSATIIGINVLILTHGAIL